MNDSQTPLQKERVNKEKNGAEDRHDSGYYYDDSTGYEVYEDDADNETPEEIDPEPDS